MGLASGARVFRAADGRFHARVPVNGRQAIFGLKSSGFRDWLVDRYLSAATKSFLLVGLSPGCWRRSRHGARFETDSPNVYVRVGRDQDDDEPSYYLDLGDHAGTVIKICASGWSIAAKRAFILRGRKGSCRYPCPSVMARSSCCANL